MIKTPLLLWILQVQLYNKLGLEKYEVVEVLYDVHYRDRTSRDALRCVNPEAVSCFSGIIWPVECIPYPLRYISLALPQTYASEALRCIMYRGEAPLTQHSLVP